MFRRRIICDWTTITSNLITWCLRWAPDNGNILNTLGSVIMSCIGVRVNIYIYIHNLISRGVPLNTLKNSLPVEDHHIMMTTMKSFSKLAVLSNVALPPSIFLFWSSQVMLFSLLAFNSRLLARSSLGESGMVINLILDVVGGGVL